MIERIDFFPQKQSKEEKKERMFCQMNECLINEKIANQMVQQQHVLSAISEAWSHAMFHRFVL